ncbi:ISLre2 family transposase [Colibacter massiliensis]|uniref:ISLre2 family transposase n=1 Tax=Colibacter massiliensis TaxID=1852379 RepID=UPI003F91EDA5
MNNIIQQIADNSTTFFNKTMEDILKGKTALSGITESVEAYSRQLGMELFRAVLQEVDEAIYESVKQTQAYHVKDKGRPRTLVTPFGELNFSRRYYQHKQTRQYHYLLDEWLNLHPYQRMGTSCQARMVTCAQEESYARAANHATCVGISRQSVLQAIRRVGTLPNSAAVYPSAKASPVKEIFVEADEDHVSMQEGHAQQLKLIYVYEAKQEVGTNRRKLVEKRVFTGYGNLWPEVAAYVQAIYGQEELPQITLLSDGGAWIQQAKHYLANVRWVLDGFHLAQYLTYIVGKGDKGPYYNALRAGRKDTFRKLVAKQEAEKPHRKERIRKAEAYILSHRKGIHTLVTHPELAGSTEGHVSHILSAGLSSRGMGWSLIGSEQIAHLRTLTENGWDVYAYVIEKLNASTSEVPIPMVSEPVLQKQCVRRKLAYCTYEAAQKFRMPGSEVATYGSWMRNIQNGGYHYLN